MLKPKIDYNCPDFYTLELTYIDGRTESLQLVSQVLRDGMWQFVTTDDCFVIISPTEVRKMHFDKNYTHIHNEQQKRLAEERAKNEVQTTSAPRKL